VKVYARLAEQAPAHRITLPDGEPAWLVTLHAGKSARRSVCQYSSKVQQRPNCLARSPSSRCVLTSANKAPDDYCAEFGTKRSQVQILSPRP
jgi:hypothetical protein